MSSSSLYSSSSSLSSSDSSPSFPSSASAASRLRRKRRDAISRAAESEWDASPSTMAALPPLAFQPSQTGTLPSWRRADELICPLASSDAPIPPFVLPSSLVPFTASEGDTDDLQAMLAQFSFPASSNSPSSRKHRRSGEVIHDSSAAATSDDGAGHGRGIDPVKRAPCGHCDSRRNNM